MCVCVYACARERSRANDCCTRACLVHFLSSFIPHACLLRACRAATCRALVPTGCGLPSTQNPARAQHTRACSTSASRTTATLRSRPKKQATAPLRPVWMLLLTPHDPNICSHTIARTHTHTQTHTHAHTHTHTHTHMRESATAFSFCVRILTSCSAFFVLLLWPLSVFCLTATPHTTQCAPSPARAQRQPMSASELHQRLLGTIQTHTHTHTHVNAHTHSHTHVRMPG